MPVDPKPEDTADDAAPKYYDGALEPSFGSSRYVKLIAIVVVVVVCFGAYRIVLGPSHYRGGEVVEKAAPVLWSEDRIVVPEGSPVRSRLEVEPVAQKDIKRDLVRLLLVDPVRD